MSQLIFKHDRAGYAGTLRVTVRSEGAHGALGAAGLGPASYPQEWELDAQGNLPAGAQIAGVAPGGGPVPPVHRLTVYQGTRPISSVSFQPIETSAGVVDVLALLHAGQAQVAAPEQLAALAVMLDEGGTKLTAMDAALSDSAQATQNAQTVASNYGGVLTDTQAAERHTAPTIQYATALPGMRDGTGTVDSVAGGTVNWEANDGTGPLDALDAPQRLRFDFTAGEYTNYFALPWVVDGTWDRWTLGLWVRVADFAVASGMDWYVQEYTPPGALLGGARVTPFLTSAQVGTPGTVVSQSGLTCRVVRVQDGYAWLTLTSDTLAEGAGHVRAFLRLFGVTQAGSLHVLAPTALPTREVSSLLAYPEEIKAGDVGGSVTVATSDSIVWYANSYAQGVYNLPGKNSVSVVSAHLPYVVYNYGHSGYNFAGLAQALRNDEAWLGALKPSQLGARFAVIHEETNEYPFLHDADPVTAAQRYGEALEGAVNIVSTYLGATPILSTEHHLGGNATGDIKRSKIVRDVALRRGLLLADVAAESLITDADQDAPLWSGGHPGTRVANVLAGPQIKALRTLPRPTQSLKAFRLRAGTAVPNYEALLFDDVHERHRRWQEILVGQTGLSAANYAQADNITAAPADVEYPSEYVALRQGQAVTMGEYAMLDVILPGTAATIDGVTVSIEGGAGTYLLLRDTASPVIDGAWHVGFVYAAFPATLQVGAVYTSSHAEYAGVQFTVEGVQDGKVITNNPYAGYPKTAGTLTKVSGTGPATINYSSVQESGDADYYAQVGRAKGSLIPYGDAAGPWTISGDRLKRAMVGDTLTLFFRKPGGSINLQNPVIEWTGPGGKHIPSPARVPEYSDKAELMPTPVITTNGGNLVGGTTALAPAQPIYAGPRPIWPRLDYGSDAPAIVNLTQAQGWTDTIATPAVPYPRQVLLQAFVRSAPAFGSLTPESFDDARLRVIWADPDGSSPLILRERVSTHLDRVDLVVTLPAFTAGARVTVMADDARNIEFYGLSARFL